MKNNLADFTLVKRSQLKKKDAKEFLRDVGLSFLSRHSIDSASDQEDAEDDDRERPEFHGHWNDICLLQNPYQTPEYDEDSYD